MWFMCAPAHKSQSTVAMRGRNYLDSGEGTNLTPEMNLKRKNSSVNLESDEQLIVLAISGEKNTEIIWHIPKTGLLINE